MDALYQPEPSVVPSDGFFFVPAAALTTYVIVATVLTFYVIYQRRATRIDRRRLKEFRDLVARLKHELRSVHEASTSTSLRCLQMDKQLDSFRRELAHLSKQIPLKVDSSLFSEPITQSLSQVRGKTHLQVFHGDIPVDDEPDDLTCICGIGSGNLQKLQENGVFYLEQIAGWNESEIERFNAILGFKGRIERERWVEQAQVKLREQGRSGAA